MTWFVIEFMPFGRMPLLGKDIGFLATQDRLKKLWKPRIGFDILDLGYSYFLVKSNSEEDRLEVVEDGP